MIMLYFNLMETRFVTKVEVFIVFQVLTRVVHQLFTRRRKKADGASGMIKTDWSMGFFSAMIGATSRMQFELGKNAKSRDCRF